MKKNGKLLAWKFILLIQFVASCALVLFAHKMDVLPQKALIELVIVLVIALILMGLLMNPKTFMRKKNNGQNEEKRKRAPQISTSVLIYNTIGKIISLIISIVLLVGAVYCTKTTKGNSIWNCPILTITIIQKV